MQQPSLTVSTDDVVSCLQQLQFQWEVVRDSCLQSGSLTQLPAAAIQKLQVAVLDVTRCFSSARQLLLPGLPTTVWADPTWQVSLLQMLALAASDTARALRMDSDIEEALLVFRAQLSAWTAALNSLAPPLSATSIRTAAAAQTACSASAMACALVRTQLLDLASIMVATVCLRLEQQQARGRQAGTERAADWRENGVLLLFDTNLLMRSLLNLLNLMCAVDTARYSRRVRWALRALHASQLVEHTSRLMLQLCFAHGSPAAGEDAMCSSTTGDEGSTLLASLKHHDGLLDMIWHEIDWPRSQPAVKGSRALHAARQRLLAGPCMRTYVAVRLTEALHALDGGSRYGLPVANALQAALAERRQQPMPAGQQVCPEDPAVPVWRTAQALSSMCCGPEATHCSAAPEGSTSGMAAGSSRPATAPEGSSSPRAGGDSYHAAAGLPPCGVYQLLLRALRLAVGPGGSGTGGSGTGGSGTGGSGAGSSGAGGSGAGGSGTGGSGSSAVPTMAASPAPPLQSAAAGAAAAPLVPLPLPVRSHAAVVDACSSALPSMHAALLSLVSGACAPARADVLVCEALPPVVALLHGATSGDGGLTVGDVLGAKRDLNAVLYLLRFLTSEQLLPGTGEAAGPSAQRRLAAAVGAGLLPALQACAVWLRPNAALLEGQAPLLSLLSEFVERHAVAAALLAPERQAAALAVALRGCRAAQRALEGSGGAPEDLSEAWTQWGDMALDYICGLCERTRCAAAQQHAATKRIVSFALQQRAIVDGQDLLLMGCSVRRLQQAGREQAARQQALQTVVTMQLGSTYVTECVVALAAAVADLNAARASAGTAGGEALAAARRAVSSWRALLLRDVRLLDVLACVLPSASRDRSEPLWVWAVVDLLHLAAYALPDDVRQHVAAGRAAARGRAVPPCAAGRGPAWLTVDAPLRALLGPQRCKRPALLAFLEGRSTAVPFEKVAELLSRYEGDGILDLPAPCDAVLLETCAHPGCTDQAHCAAAARGLGVPRLRACAKCELVRYCSRACQAEHWRQWHKDECGKGWW